MSRKHKTSLGDLLLEAGLRPTSGSNKPHAQLGAENSVRKNRSGQQTGSERHPYWYIRQAAKAAARSQKHSPDLVLEPALTDRIVEYARKFLARSDKSARETQELLLALLFISRHSAARSRIIRVLSDALCHEHFDVDHLDAAFYRAKSRYLFEDLATELRLGEHRARLEQKKTREKTIARATATLKRIRKKIMEVKANPELPTPSLELDDLRLIALWGGAKLTDKYLTPTSVHRALSSKYEFAKLWSARAAELAAKSYYESLSNRVEDVALTQLEYATSDWKTHDLLVDGQPIDVKSARQSTGNPRRFSGYLVPRFKKYREDSLDVEVVAVLNRPYRSAKKILSGTGSESLVLGEVSQPYLTQLSNWFTEFCNHVSRAGLYCDDKIQGWCFSYSWNSISADSTVVDDAGELAELIAKHAWLQEEVSFPRFLKAYLALSTIATYSRSDDTKNVYEDEAMRALKLMKERVGITRPSLYLFVLGFTLTKLLDLDKQWRPRYLNEILFWPSHTDSEVWPLGIYDPLKYVHELVGGLDRLWASARDKLLQFRRFVMPAPSILIALDNNGKNITLLAYCGGWRPLGETSIPCGENPLIFGVNSTCHTCARLICHCCGYCSDECNAARGQ